MATPEEGVRRTISQYAMLCDDGRFAEWADLFDTDARFHVMGQTHYGRASIRAFIEAAQPTEARGRHANGATVIDIAPGGLTAQAWTDYLFFDRNGKVTSAGRYHDELALHDDGRWRFLLREIVFRDSEPDLTVPPAADGP